MIWQHIYKLNFFFFCVYLSCIETAFISVEKVFVCLNLLEHSRTRLQRATVTEFRKNATPEYWFRNDTKSSRREVVCIGPTWTATSIG